MMDMSVLGLQVSGWTQGNKDDSKSWRLQSAVASLDGSNLLKSWDNGEVIFRDKWTSKADTDRLEGYQLEVGETLKSNLLSVRLARILVFDKALSVQEIKHYEFLIKRNSSWITLQEITLNGPLVHLRREI